MSRVALIAKDLVARLIGLKGQERLSGLLGDGKGKRPVAHDAAVPQ